MARQQKQGGHHTDAQSVRLVQKALADIRKGKMVILTDDEDRENEGDIVIAADKITPKAINFMATHARGLICLSLTEERLRQLNIPLMVQDNSSPFQTAFTVSIEAATGVTTGISAADRSRTIQAAVAPRAKPGDLVRPGHIFPLRAREGGVLVRSGQTEGSVDLARMAGLSPAGVICEIMNPDGTMARRPALERFAKKHKLLMLSVADLIRYRLQHEQLVGRLAESVIERRGQGTWRSLVYQSDVDRQVHMAFVKGDITGNEPVLTRVHRACLVGDVFRGTGCKCGVELEQAFEQISAAGRGVVVYLQKEIPAKSQMQCIHTVRDEPFQDGRPQMREFGVGAQILRDLGLSRLKLLTRTPKKWVGLDSFHLELVDQVLLQTTRSPKVARKA